MRPLYFLIASATFWLSSPSSLHLNTDTTPNEYLYTTISWGTPAQSFDVLVDTTDHSSWVYGSTAATSEATFDSAASDTYLASTDDPTSFKYQGSSTEIDFAFDTLTLDGETIPDIVE